MTRLFNYKVILYMLGFLTLIIGVSILLCAPVSMYYGDKDYWAIILSGVITIICGLTLYFLFRNTDKNISKRDGYIIVCAAWIIFSIFGSLPFMMTGYIPSFTDAFFETMSGFTTTGASILKDVESLSHGILFWRSLTHWLGGMGIIVMSIAILPLLGIGGMQLYIAEVPGPTPDKLHPRIKETAQKLWGIYIIFTITEVILLSLGGMSVFDSVCHSFASMGTGGFSTWNSSIAGQTPYIQYILTVFMFLAGANFTLSYFALHLDFKKIWENEEFKAYLFFTLGFATIISLGLFFHGQKNYETCFRDAIFQVVSIMTTTGFASVDYEKWPLLMIMLLFVVMFFGGSTGSTGGGIKIMRIVLLIKSGFFELKRLVHPNAVIPVRFNNQAVSPAILSNVMAFVMFYIFMFVIGTIVMSALNYDMESSFGAVAATLGNIGPGIGDVGPMDNYSHVPAIGKWFLSFLMLIGRLEIFTVFIFFSRDFWKK